MKLVLFLLSAFIQFTAWAQPTVDSFSPTSGVIGTSIIITGTNFSETPGDNEVTFGGIPAVVTASTSTSITTSVPAGLTAGSVTVSVTVAGDTDSQPDFIVLPLISGFAPGSGNVGTSITISGSGFSATPASNTVTINGINATVSSSTTTSISTTVPAGVTAGASPISVTVGGQLVNSVSNFTVTPTIASFTPDNGPVGTVITITGTGFSATPANNTVTVNGINATVSSSTTTSISTTVPAGVTAGASPISVTVGGQLVNSVSNFTVTPTITSFAPASGAVGATVIITGTGFSTTPGNNVVKFNNNITATVSASTTTSITTTVPAGASNGTISVTVGGQTVNSASSFTVLDTPSITSLSPTSGAVGASIQINGDNFSTVPAENVVEFNGTPAVVTASLPNRKRLTVTVPVGATTGPVTVTLNGVTVSSPSNFTVLPTPTITNFSPTSGAIGADIIITGTNFNTNNTTVTFNGTDAIVSSVTSTSITTTVPVGATTGPIQVTSSGVTITSVTNFTVLPTPTITNFSPASGAIGSSVTITGTNFSTTPENNEVKFNGTLATVTTSTATSITTIVPVGATTGLISLTVSGVTLSSGTPFTVLGAPTITNFTPGSGAVGAAVTITGTNFGVTPTVSFNGVAAIVTSSTATSINTTVPVGALTGPISVTANGVTIASSSNFIVLPTPTISGFSPISGAVGTSVVISGTNFSATAGNNVVKFNNNITATVISSTTNSITTSVPSGASTGKISVTVSGVTIISTDDFTVLPTPTISSLSPSSGAVGAVITITGTNFNITPANNLVTFNGVSAVVTSATATSLTTSVPLGATTGLVSLTVNGVTVNSGSNFTVLPTPTISGFTPSSGAVGAVVTISGTNFSPSPVVSFNGITAIVTASNASSITTSVPLGASTGKIAVTTSGVTITSLADFTVLPAPTISSFSPISGAIGTSVIITGTNFSNVPGDHVVRFNNTIAVITSSTTTSITATVPVGATTGKISVAVSGVTVQSTDNFTVLSAPTLTSFSPTSGAVGALVTITGTNFNTTPTVSFNGVVATVNSFNATTINTEVPIGALSGPISITVNGVNITSGSNFTVLATPTIAGFSPTSGAIGTIVNITGTNFNTTPSVTFNGTNASITSSTTSSIATSVPVGASTGPISILVNGVTISSGSNFTVLPTPSISSFTPSSGAAGTSVTINGNNFGPSPIVLFNGVSAIVSSSTSTSIVAIVPPGTSTGKISVTSSGVTVQSGPNFTVLPTPTITSFTPVSGAVGAVVVINGTNFSGSPTVQFGGISATVTSSNATSITTAVPIGASTGLISVTTSGITISSASNFTVLPTHTITSFSPGSGAVGATVIISGTNFSTTPGDHVVRFNNTIATVSASTSTSITATVPAGATNGKISVTVNGVTVLSDNNFTVLPSPTISGFSPSGAGVGATVTITGTNFISAPFVEFNGTDAVVTSFTSTTITTTVPAGAGSGPISVSLSGVTVSSASNFTVFGTPSITSFTPNNGGLGVVVTITGTNFSSTPSLNTVTFNGTSAVVTASTTTSITTTVPFGATTGPISITVNGITGTSSTNFTVPTPTITSFSPTSAAIGAVISITGTNFSSTPANNTVRFNGIVATVNTSTTTNITAVVPSGVTSGPVSVTVNGVTGTSSSNFTVLPTPTFTGFSPSSGAIGATVVISGTNFSSTPSNNVVRFNGTTAVVTSSTTNSITVTVPAGATTGVISVTVSGITLNSASNFTVLSTPTFTGFNPTGAAVGASIILSGTNFSTTPSNNVVQFNGVTATVTAATANSITAVVPAGASTGKISITVSGLTLISASNFSVLPTPTLTGFSPGSGAVGTPVTITGTNFNTTPANNSVSFNGANATVISSTASSLATTVPAGATTGPISVTVSGVTISSLTDFQVSPTPAITSFSPSTGAVGASVTITGVNFSTTPANNILTFNGVTAIVTSSTATSITTTVPAGATTGKISLALNGITVFSTNNFNVAGTPTLTGFSPGNGAPGASIVITGTNFSTTPANNAVSFNGVSATVTASTATTITATVPVGATTGPISITVSGITITSGSNFSILSLPSISGFTPDKGAVGATVVINGQNFSPTPANNVVKFNNTTSVVTASTATSITTTVPAGATTGKITVTVSGVTLTSADDFQVLPAPTITGFSPQNGSVGAIVTITGTNFSTTPSENVVSFNGITATVLTSTSTVITVAVPANALTGPISVFVSGVTRTTATNFTVLATPVISGFTPSGGAISAVVTISGSNFSTTPANNQVKFNGTSSVVTASTSSSITTTVPVGATTGKISLTLNGVTVLSSTDFTILPTPTITGFNPLSGAVGATIVITGTNFNTTPSNNIVMFNEVNAIVTEATATSLTVTVPPGASTGKVMITVNGVTITSNNNFIVMPSPFISAINPSSGYEGDLVNIIGLNFDSDEPKNVVTFNGTPAVVDAASTTIITTTVPSGASSGPICVTVNGATICSFNNFTVLKIIPDDTTPPSIINETPSEITIGSDLRIRVKFVDPETDIISTNVKVKSFSTATDISTTMNKNGEYYEFTVPNIVIGELGVEYQVQATNEKLLSVTSSFLPVRIRIPGAGLVIPYSIYGNTLSNYKMFSVPLELDKPAVSDVFDELPALNKSSWRISQYESATKSNKELLSTSPIQPGVGYWLIIKDNPLKQITTGAGTTVNVQTPFSINLKAGWNQIGNPYNFNLLWSDLVVENPGLPLSYRGYNGSIKNFENKTTLSVMDGGFVNVPSDMTLKFPVKKSIGSRITSDQVSLENSIDQDEWEIDFTVEQGGISNVIGGLGMRLNASEGFDIYDGFSMPRFDEYLDVNHTKKLNDYHFSKDVVPTTDHYAWTFSVDASNSLDQASINWNNNHFGNNELNLILYDETAKVWLDMKQHNSYKFTPPSNFRVLYGPENYVKNEIGFGNAKILEVSPNPAKGPITIHLFIPDWQRKVPVQLELKSVTGVTLANIFSGELASGYQPFEWSGEDNANRLPSGVYLVQMRCGDVLQTVRIILLN